VRLWRGAVLDVVVIAVTMAASVMLTAGAGYWLARSDDARFLVQMRGRGEHAVTDEEAQAIWKTLEKARLQSVWLMCPAVAILTGLVGGALSRRHAWQRAAVGAGPFAWVFSVGTQGLERGALFFVMYVALAGTAGLLAARIRCIAEDGGRPTRG
jgi:hypothetical protein